MINNIKKVEKINNLVIYTYGFAFLISLFNTPKEKFIIMLIDLVISIVILVVMNKKMEVEPTLHRSPVFYYAFLALVTITIYLSGIYQSELFPELFIFPIIYISVNFPRKASTGVSIFGVVIIWLILLQDPTLEKLDLVIITTIVIIVIPRIIGFIVKEYISLMKRLVKASKKPYNIMK